MQFPFPFIDELTIPTGAGPGDPRLVLSSNFIQLFDAANNLVGEWRPDQFGVFGSTSGAFIVIDPDFFGRSVILFRPPDSPGEGAYASGSIDANYDGLETPYISINSPNITGENGSTIRLYGENTADGLEAHIDLAPNIGGGANGYVDIPDNGSNVDFRIGGISVGRGTHTGFDFVATGDQAHTVSGVTDMLINNYPMIAGRAYEVVLKTRYLVSSLAVWDLNFRVNGVQVDQFWHIEEAGGNGRTIYTACIYEAPSTAAFDLDVFAAEVSGASTLTLDGNAVAPRRLYVRDLGIL